MCVKLDPKFEKHDREACLQTHWLDISTLLKFGPDRGFVAQTTYACTIKVPQILWEAAQFDETGPGNVSSVSRMSIKEIKAKHDKLHLQKNKSCSVRLIPRKSVALIRAGAAET